MSSQPSATDSSSGSTTTNMRQQQRRASVTSAALSNLFRSSSNAQNQASFSGPVTAAAIHEQRRRLSISTLGLAGTAPGAPPAFPRRGSLCNSDSLDSEEDVDSSARTAPVTPFNRRMSFGAPAMWNMRGPGGSPGSSNDPGFIWSEQLRSRAESTVAAAAAAATGPQTHSSFYFPPVFSSSPPRIGNNPSGGGAPSTQPAVSSHHDRAKSVSDMPAPPAQVPQLRERRKPDHMQERILKGDFYMD